MMRPIQANIDRSIFEVLVPNNWVRASFYAGVALIALGVIGAAIKAFNQRNQEQPEASKGFTATAAVGVALTVPAIVTASGLMPSAPPQVEVIHVMCR